MANFQNNAITDSGRALLSHVQMGAVFTPTKIVVGSGYMPPGKTARTMTDVVTPVKNLTINKKQRTNDGKAIFGGVYSNQDISQDWYFRELALYAKAVYPEGQEIAECLYSYGNAGDQADLMPAYTTGQPVERQMDLVVYVGNDAKVDLTIESGVYLTQEQAEKMIAEALADIDLDITDDTTGLKYRWGIQSGNAYLKESETEDKKLLVVMASQVGKPNGVAGLDGSGKVPAGQLPKMDYDPAGSAEAVQQALTAHTGNKDNPHAVTAAQVGAFTKQETLTPETAALYGLSSSAIPDDVLSFLGKYNQHWWRRRESKSHYEAVISQATEEDVLNTVNAFMVNINYSSDITISSSGKVTLLAPIKNLTIEENDLSRSGTGVSKANTLKGKYWNGTMIGPSDYERDLGDRYTAPNAPNAKMTDYGDYKKLTLQSSAVSTKFVDGIGPWEYVQSNDRKAYPDSGIVEGVEYQYLGIPFANIVTAPTIVTGSYVGTGDYNSGTGWGSSNPTSLTFDFAPKLLIIGWQETLDNGFFSSNLGERVTSDNYYSIYTGALTTQFKQYRGFGDPSSSYAKKSSDGKTITWYATAHANAQRNDRRYKYYYLAIG